MEAVAYVPVCASPVLAAFGRGVNDAMPDGVRQRLLPLISRLVGSAAPSKERARAYYLVDRAVRHWTADAMFMAGHTDAATKLRALLPIMDGQSAMDARADAYADAAASLTAADADPAHIAALWDDVIATFEGVIAL